MVQVTPRTRPFQPSASFGNGGDGRGPLQRMYRLSVCVYAAAASPLSLLPTLHVWLSHVIEFGIPLSRDKHR